MNQSVKIYLVPLALSLGIWYLALRPAESSLMKILNTIPAFQEQKGKILTDTLTEIAKIGAVYAGITLSGILK